MSKQNLMKVIASVGLTPLFLALFFATHHFFDWHILSGTAKHFARLNAYIYIHYCSALILVLMAGIQLGRDMDRKGTPLFMFFNLLLFLLVWLSYQSLGDFHGVLLIFMTWLAAFTVDVLAHKNKLYPRWFEPLKFKFNIIGLVLIGLVLLINR